MPYVTCGSKNVASSEQITMSDSLSQYIAPPAHMPCTAVMTGFHTCCCFGLRPAPGSSWFQMFGGKARRSLTSRPVQKARSPAARSTTAWTSSSSRIVPHTSTNSSIICWLKAFITSGRLMVIVATWSPAAKSKMIVSYPITCLLRDPARAERGARRSAVHRLHRVATATCRAAYRARSHAGHSR